MEIKTITSKFTVRSQFGTYFGVSEVGVGPSSFTFNGAAASTMHEGTYLPPAKITVVGAYDVVYLERLLLIRLPDTPPAKPSAAKRRRPCLTPDEHLEAAYEERTDA